ncbi:MAG: YbhB/YbcL family Raf kinase inhibitor-like protein [Actinobacteria bacterium HGW-Actinobacteria-2]|nr:MAG: YbhB/YbcL family Raf kinase inhibitor-like protein [Actinobacteria bacterium HGW-Actinobacteria-2]
MDLSSTSITPGSYIAMTHAEPGVGGQNISPELSWTPGPEGTASYTITCFDPDAPTGSGWWHWVVTDIPAEVTSLAEGADLPDGARSWTNDYGYSGWGGPWPPPGPAHHYEFRVFAVGVPRLDVPDDASCASARLTLSFNTLAEAGFTALFANPAS